MFRRAAPVCPSKWPATREYLTWQVRCAKQRVRKPEAVSRPCLSFGWGAWAAAQIPFCVWAAGGLSGVLVSSGQEEGEAVGAGPPGIPWPSLVALGSTAIVM